METKKKAATESEFATVRIHASQRVRYDQEVTMPKAEWERIKALPERQAKDAITDWIDTRNVIDADEISDDFEAYTLDKKGRPSGDRYGA